MNEQTAMEFKEGNQWKCCFDSDYEKLCPWSDAEVKRNYT